MPEVTVARPNDGVGIFRRLLVYVDDEKVADCGPTRG